MLNFPCSSHCRTTKVSHSVWFNPLVLTVFVWKHKPYAPLQWCLSKRSLVKRETQSSSYHPGFSWVEFPIQGGWAAAGGWEAKERRFRLEKTHCQIWSAWLSLCTEPFSNCHRAQWVWAEPPPCHLSHLYTSPPKTTNRLSALFQFFMCEGGSFLFVQGSIQHVLLMHSNNRSFSFVSAV